MILLFVIALMGSQGGEVQATSQAGLFSPGIFVLLYHPQEEGFESAFRQHLHWLKEDGYQTISLEALVRYLKGEEVALPPKPIVLTFDDGTLENYTLVYPILKELGCTGTAFVITGLNLVRYSKKFWWREVDLSGVLDVEDHSRSHGLIWVSPKIADFYSNTDPGDEFLIKGMDWRLGAPIYEYDEELINDRYFPDRGIANLCVRHVAQNGGKDFFKKEGWREELFQVVDDFRSHHQEKGSYETESQEGTRINQETVGSKRIIERTIGHGKEVDFFAYPWGVYDEALILELKQSGFRGALTTDWGENFPGDDPFKIKRLVITSDMTVEDLADLLTVE
jgi:peptidoglycan/xylan/chitin deacetylase (PgdA/CDA1 family)